MRRSAISCAPVWRRSAVCVRPVSNSPAFSCVMAITTIGRREHDAPSLDGRTEFDKRRITSCWKTASPQSRRRRRGGSSGSPYRGGAAGLVAGPGGARPTSAARDGSGRGGDGSRRTRRHHPLRRSPPAHGVSRSGSVRALQRRHTPTGRHHEAGNGAARRMLIEAAWSYRFPARISREQLLRQEVWQSRSATPRGRPKSGFVGVSQARPGGKITHRGHGRDRSRTGSFVWAIANEVQAVGHDELKSRPDITKGGVAPGDPSDSSKAGGTVTARGTLIATIGRITTNAGRWTKRKVRDASAVRRRPNPRINININHHSDDPAYLPCSVADNSRPARARAKHSCACYLKQRT